MIEPAAWRREKRGELYAARRPMTYEMRREAARTIGCELDDRCDHHRPTLVGRYWPIKCVPDLLPWARRRADRLRFCLPVVVSRGQVVEYWRWTPGDPMQSGVRGIQTPMQQDVVTPDLVIAPLIGFDRDRYRLGNGGGHFDRTLGACADPPIAIGVGSASSELETIYPQPHDISIDDILTERM
jgi:5-formyltetrahydrofolate cyclo-ligase